MSLTNIPLLESILGELIWARRDVFIELAEKSFRPINKASQTSSQQGTEYWIDGFIALLMEALQSNETTYQKFYLERLVSDMTLIGVHPQLLLQLSVAWSVLVSNEIVQVTPITHRADAVRWFSTFFAGYIGAISNTLQGQPIYTT
jgi:hypothetical protein